MPVVKLWLNTNEIVITLLPLLNSGTGLDCTVLELNGNKERKELVFMGYSAFYKCRV